MILYSIVIDFHVRMFWKASYIIYVCIQVQCQNISSIIFILYSFLTPKPKNVQYCSIIIMLNIKKRLFTLYSFNFLNIFLNKYIFSYYFLQYYMRPPHSALGGESTSSFWRLHMGWLFWILETWQTNFEHHWIRKSSLKFTP